MSVTSVETEKGLMQAEADADRKARQLYEKWFKNFKGKLAQPEKPAQAQPPVAPSPQGY